MLQILELDDRRMFRCPACGTVYELFDAITRECCALHSSETFSSDPD